MVFYKRDLPAEFVCVAARPRTDHPGALKIEELHAHQRPLVITPPSLAEGQLSWMWHPAIVKQTTPEDKGLGRLCVSRMQ
jgi:hypothetical protein